MPRLGHRPEEPGRAAAFEVDAVEKEILIAIFQGPLVEPLKDPLVFAKLEIKYGALLFPTGLDYGPDILRVWCENGSVEGQEVTDQLAHRYLEGAASSLQHV